MLSLLHHPFNAIASLSCFLSPALTDEIADSTLASLY